MMKDYWVWLKEMLKVVEEGLDYFIVDCRWYGVREESERRKGIEIGDFIRMWIK